MGKILRALSVFFHIFLLLFLLILSEAASQERPKKKLIEYGWDIPDPEFVRDNIKVMEKRPFDGIIFGFPEGIRTKIPQHLFDTKKWKESDIQPQMDILADIKWEKFTDNFLILYATNPWKMDWFNDTHWNAISHNMKLLSKTAKAGRCTGICFDTEPYGINDPFVYPGRYAGKSFEEVSAKVRVRGAQFITALQTYMPELRLLNFFLLAHFKNVVDEPDLEIRKEKQINMWLTLVPAFINGMLDGAGPGTIIIDGNEDSYYYESPNDYYLNYHLIKQRAQALVFPENRPKYISKVQAGMALYVDQVLAKRNAEITSKYLTPAERLKFFEHNVYYALTTSDEYVWCYGELLHWWQNFVPIGQAGSRKDVSGTGALPEGLEEAIISARHKYDQGKPLGFEIDAMIKKAQEKKKK